MGQIKQAHIDCMPNHCKVKNPYGCPMQYEDME